MFYRYIEYLKKDTHLSPLTNMVDDPESPGKEVHKFILYTKDHNSRSKIDIINAALIYFVHMHKMKKSSFWVD